MDYPQANLGRFNPRGQGIDFDAKPPVSIVPIGWDNDGANRNVAHLCKWAVCSHCGEEFPIRDEKPEKPARGPEIQSKKVLKRKNGRDYKAGCPALPRSLEQPVTAGLLSITLLNLAPFNSLNNRDNVSPRPWLPKGTLVVGPFHGPHTCSICENLKF